MTPALVITLCGAGGALSALVAHLAIEAWDRAWLRRRARRMGRAE